MKYICSAHQNSEVNQLPVKEKVLSKKLRYLNWFIILVKGEVFVQLRTQKDIWQNLNEFYALETETKPGWTSDSVADFIFNQFSLKPLSTVISPEYTQQLTHRKIKAVFIIVELKQKPAPLRSQSWLAADQLSTLAFPRIINEYLDHRSVQLF